MKSCLPNKLIIIRKHFNYSQQDVAKALNISVSKYMGYENGSSMMNMDQLYELSELYHIRFDEMFLNSTEIELPDVEKNEDEDVPIAVESEIARELGVEKTRVNNVVFDDTNQYTQLEDFEKTTVTHIVNDPELVPDKKEKNKNLPLIIGAAAVVVVLIIIAIIFLTSKHSDKISNELGKENRFVATEEYTAFIKDNGSLKVYGDNADLEFEDVVQISSYDDHTIGLTEEGEIVCSDTANSGVCEFASDFNGVTMIASGKNHIVALNNDGTVSCEGSESACAVEEWTNINKVYAGNEVTFGLTKTGNLYVAGDNEYAEDMSDETNVSRIVSNDENSAVLYNDGTVKVFGSDTYDTENWLGITAVALGDDFVAGLKNDGSLVLAGNKELSETTSSFTNVSYISAYGDYYAVVIDGKVYGAGNNDNNQYLDTNSSDQLSKVEGFKYTIGAKKINLSWDPVEGADYYQVSIDTTPNTFEIKSATATYSIDASKFTDGNTYYVKIIAYSDDKSIQSSEEASFEMVYTANSNQLDKVTNIKGTIGSSKITFTWDAVDNATKYTFNITPMSNFETQTVTTNTIDIDLSRFTSGTKYTVTINAVGDSSVLDSPDATYEFTYSKEKIANAKNFNYLTDGSTVKFTWDKVDHAASYIIKVSVNGTEKVSTQTTDNSWITEAYNFNDGDSLNIQFQSIAEEGYDDSDIQTFVMNYTSSSSTAGTTYTVSYVDTNGVTVYSDKVVSGESYTVVDPTSSINNAASVTMDHAAGSTLTISGDTTINVTNVVCRSGYSYSSDNNQIQGNSFGCK